VLPLAICNSVTAPKREWLGKSGESMGEAIHINGLKLGGSGSWIKTKSDVLYVSSCSYVMVMSKNV